jgi:hypothetical protein
MELYWGDETLNLKLDSSKTVSQLPDANVPWTGKGFAEALEFPFNFPPLDQCATPDDRVVVTPALPKSCKKQPVAMWKGITLPMPWHG